MHHDQFIELLEIRTEEHLAKGLLMDEAKYQAAKGLAWELANGKMPQYSSDKTIKTEQWALPEIRAKDIAQDAVLSFGHGKSGPHIKVMCFQDAIEGQVTKAAKEGFSHGLGIGFNEAMAQMQQMSAELVESAQALLASDADVAQVTNEELRSITVDEEADVQTRAQAESVLRLRDALEDFSVKTAEQKNKTGRLKP